MCIGSGVRPSVCPVDRQQQRRAAGLLLSSLRAGDIDRQLPAPRRSVDRYRLQAPDAQQQMRV